MLLGNYIPSNICVKSMRPYFVVKKPEKTSIISHFFQIIRLTKQRHRYNNFFQSNFKFASLHRQFKAKSEAWFKIRLCTA